MRIKLSMIALGISLAYGATAAMAANTASVSQTGMLNDAVVQQFANDNTSAAISVFGSNNNDTINQEFNRDTQATITVFGSRNAGTVTQNRVEDSSAIIFQAADAGEATITQTGGSGHQYGWGYGGHSGGRDLNATINQTYGWGNVAWVTQKGSDADALINQSGFRNTAGIEQDGHGYGYGNTQATITQTGMMNDGYVNQAGRNLVASISQSGSMNEAVIMQKGSGYTATVTQVGYGNSAFVNQR